MNKHNKSLEIPSALKFKATAPYSRCREVSALHRWAGLYVLYTIHDLPPTFATTCYLFRFVYCITQKQQRRLFFRFSFWLKAPVKQIEFKLNNLHCIQATDDAEAQEVPRHISVRFFHERDDRKLVVLEAKLKKTEI